MSHQRGGRTAAGASPSGGAVSVVVGSSATAGTDSAASVGLSPSSSSISLRMESLPEQRGVGQVQEPVTIAMGSQRKLFLFNYPTIRGGVAALSPTTTLSAQARRARVQRGFVVLCGGGGGGGGGGEGGGSGGVTRGALVSRRPQSTSRAHEAIHYPPHSGHPQPPPPLATVLLLLVLVRLSVGRRRRQCIVVVVGLRRRRR